LGSKPAADGSDGLFVWLSSARWLDGGEGSCTECQAQVAISPTISSAAAEGCRDTACAAGSSEPATMAKRRSPPYLRRAAPFDEGDKWPKRHATSATSCSTAAPTAGLASRNEKSPVDENHRAISSTQRNATLTISAAGVHPPAPGAGAPAASDPDIGAAWCASGAPAGCRRGASSTPSPGSGGGSQQAPAMPPLAGSPACSSAAETEPSGAFQHTDASWRLPRRVCVRSTCRRATV